MRLNAWIAAIVVSAAVIAAPFAFAGDHPTEGQAREAVSKLWAPDASPQPEAHGICSIRDGQDFQRFTVVIEGLHGDGALHVRVGDGEEHMVHAGQMHREGGWAKLERTTLEGGELPLGVESVRALGGRRVEVVDGEEHVVCAGEVPVIRDEPPPPPPPQDDPVVTRAEMHRTNEVGDKDCRGTLIAARRADGSALKLEVARLDPEHGYLVYLWAEQDLVIWGDFRTNGEGEGFLVAESGSERGLPLGADAVGDLAGRRVEVRDRDGHLYLYGEIPACETHEDEKRVHETDRQRDDEHGTDVTISVDIKPERGREELHIVVKRLPRKFDSPGKTARRVLSIRFEDSNGDMTRVGGAAVNGRSASRRWTTRSGRQLPLGVESLRDLSGRRFEMYLGSTRVAAGNLPQY